MQIRIKKLCETAKMPTKGTVGAACFDLYSAEDKILYPNVPVKIRTGLAFEVPFGYCMVVYSRSSTFIKGIVCTPLIVDSDYRGEVFVSAMFTGGELASNEHYELQAGDRIAQVKIEKLEDTEFVWSDTLTDTARGTGGYGSTGR